MFAIAGNPVPSRSEFFYVLRVFRTYRHDYLPTDWTFAGGAPEHFLFNHLFGLLGLALPIEAVGWIGRLLAWSLLAIALLRLGAALGIGRWPMVIATCLWLGIGQSLVADSWMVGGFEASNFGYLFLVLSLGWLMSGRERLAALGLGISASFHPSVGLWGGIASFAAFVLADRPGLRRIVVFGSLLALGALPGVASMIPVVFGQHAAGQEEWKLFVVQRMPYHLDPLSWQVRSLAVLPVMLGFIWLYVRRLGAPRPWRIAAWFLTASFVVFVAGFACRVAEKYTWLSTFPFRIFPLLTPLVFLGAALEWLGRESGRRAPALVAGGLLATLMVLPDPLTPYAKALASKRLAWGAPSTDLRRCYAWIAENTPRTAIGMVPPKETQHAWYFLERGLVVSIHYNVYDRVQEWRERAESFAGEFRAEEGRDERALAFYEAIPPDRMAALLDRYDASFLVTRVRYPFPVGFEAGEYRVYLVGNAGDLSGSPLDSSAAAWSAMGTTR